MNSAIVWRGRSLLDRETPIVVVLSGLEDSRNTKTGSMVQSYILVDGERPVEAVHSGRDSAICGDCKHRGDGTGGRRTCYVNLGRGTDAVGRRLAELPFARPASLGLIARLAGRQFRIGTYGDPAAVPVRLWRALLGHADGWTGYTHQWRTYADGRDFLMASVDSAKEWQEAHDLGWRTFRVRRVGHQIDALLSNEVTCPASAEAGHSVQCDRCQLCHGASKRAKDVAIIDHSNQGRAALRRLPVLQLSLGGI